MMAKLLHEKGVELALKKIGNYMTSIDMAGLSLTLIRLADDEWLDALNAPVTTPLGKNSRRKCRMDAEQALNG